MDKEHSIKVEAGKVTLEGNLSVPKAAKGIVLFAHGSGSGRFSPRNRYVAGVLQKRGLATLLFDLLTTKEEVIDNQTRALRFNIELLAERVVGATDWFLQDEKLSQLSIGYFGASTGAAAALVATSRRPDNIGAIVSRGGRPDLAMVSLPKVKAPTLLIVGENDPVVIELNRKALDKLTVEKELVIIPGATHLFEEPGTLEEVARYAADWFARYLQGTLYLSK